MYTYAFFKTPTSPLLLSQGIRGSLKIITSENLSAIVEPALGTDNLPDTDEQLMQAVLIHDQIIREAFQQTPLLPLRFGTCFSSESALVQHLQLHQQQYLDKLEQFQGQAEYLLKAVPLEFPSENLSLSKPNSPSPPLKGRDYFLAKKQLHQRQLEHQHQQNQQWHDWVNILRQSYPNLILPESQTTEQRIYLLIPQTQEPQLRDQLQQWQTQNVHWQLTLSEALPPYHFL